MAQSFSGFCFTFLISFLMITSTAVAAESAEIININYKYKIAFTDLSQNDVKPGELVAVIVPDGKKVYLKVLETYPVMAKLTVPDDAAHALTDDQFSAITVGSQVAAGDKVAVVAPVTQAKTAAKAVKPEAVVAKVTARTVEPPKPSVRGTTALPVAVPAAPVVDTGLSPAVLESRLDQMMANNVKLVDSITALIAEKNLAEAKAREKESVAVEASQKADALSTENAALRSRAEALGAKVTVLEQDKAAQQKKIESLNQKLDELKKKLAKTVEIINTNMKAYEKK